MKKWKELSQEEKKKAIIINTSLIIVGIVLIILSLFSTELFGENNAFSRAIGDFNNFWDKMVAISPKIWKSLVIIIVFILASKACRLIAKKVANRAKKKSLIESLVDSMIKYVMALIMLFSVLNIWGVKATTLLAGAGIFALVIGLGMQSLIADILAGLFIIFEHTFEVGDIVTVDGFRGTVKEVGIRNTKFEDIGGDIKILANSDIRSIINMTKELSVATCNVQIEYNESLSRVEDILLKNFEDIKNNIPTIVFGPEYKGVTELGSHGVTLLIIAKCKENDKAQTSRELNREIKLLFDNNDINIPFPQVVVNNPTKPKHDKLSPKTTVKKANNKQSNKQPKKKIDEKQNDKNSKKTEPLKSEKSNKKDILKG